MSAERRERNTYREAIVVAHQRLREQAESRRAAAAWARPGEPLSDIRALWALEAALDGFDAHPGLPDDQADEEGLAAWLAGITDARQLLRELVPDPRRRFRITLARDLPWPAGDRRDEGGRRRGGRVRADGRTMSLDVAEAIVHALSEGFTGVDDLLARTGASAADRGDLLHTGRRLREAQQDPIAADQAVGVLLPLRLETRFEEVRRGGWRLKLRIYPEEASFDRHPGLPTEAEIAHTAEMWQRCDGLLGSEAGKAAFTDLARRVGGPRAAWLATSLPVERDDADGRISVHAETPRHESERVFHRPRGLPDQLEVWIARAGEEPRMVDPPLVVDHGTIEAQADLFKLFADQVDPNNPGRLLEPDAPPPDTWWTSFEEAVRVGLGTVVDLGETADDIDALYVVGLGAADPAELFSGHQAAGRLAVVAPGTPTNTVSGEATVDLGREPEFWWEVATRSGFDQPGTRDLGMALCGGRSLGYLPGGDLDLRPVTESLVSALFPVLWGRALKDVWRQGIDVWHTGRWARRSLAPEGALPTVRIEDQPYGVLPATSLANWEAHSTDPVVEVTGVRPWAVALLSRWAAAAEGEGNVIGADTDRLVDLLVRVPSTGAWAARAVHALDLLRSVALSWGRPDLAQTWLGQWVDRAVGALDAGLPFPHRRLLPYGSAQPFELPIWQAYGVEAVRSMLESSHAKLLALSDPEWTTGDDLPAPLLARLVRHALVLTNAELGRLYRGDWAPDMLPPVSRPELLADWALRDVRNSEVNGQQRELDQAPDDLTARLPLLQEGLALARGWEAVRDGVVALAEDQFGEEEVRRAFTALLDSASHRIDPWVSGMAWRRLRWLQDRGVAWRLGAYGWVDRPAPATRENLRPGPTPAGLLHTPNASQALAAALLRDHAVREQDLARWQLSLDSDKVRAAVRLAAQVRAGTHLMEALGRLVEELAGDPALVLWLREHYPMRPEHGGRRVCDGEAVVRAAVQGASFPQHMPVGEIAALQTVLDTYSDLLVADAVFDVVEGRADMAAEAMEAAAGLGPPPELRALRTHREGTALSTAVLAVLPPGELGSSPPSIADPYFAALLATETGGIGGDAWYWHVGDELVNLGGLGLEPIDVLAVPAAALTARLRVAAGAPPVAPIVDAPALRTVRRLSSVLGVPDGLPRQISGIDDEAVLASAVRQLLTRLEKLLEAAAELVENLSGGGTPAAAAEAERWGIVPPFDTPPELHAGAAARVLTARIDAEREAAAANPDPAPTHESIAHLAERLRVLCGVASLPIVVDVPRSSLRPDLRPRAVSEKDSWLETVAAVRPPLARLEAHQLSTPRPWVCWSTEADDPWMSGWLGANRSEQSAPEQVVAYGPPAFADLEEHHPVGVVLIDRWAETVPSRTHVTAAAFGFNGPKARAPQAILLAVPPDVRRALDTQTLVQICAETRDLARARMATPETLQAYDVALPTPLLAGWGDGERYANVDLRAHAE